MAAEAREAANGGTLHYSTGKPGVDQIPADVLMEIGRVYEYGAKKYARNNWTKGTDWSQFIGSDLRHLYKYMMGEDYDNCDGSEGCAGAEAEFCKIHSRCHHLAQHIWNGISLLFYYLHGLGTDDRLSTVLRERVGNPCTGFINLTGYDWDMMLCALYEGHEGGCRYMAPKRFREYQEEAK